jgi:uncharacterized membrane protein YfcA
VLSALAGIGGGVIMVPFLYLVYAHTGVSLSAQTVVAHATSLGVAFAASTVGTWRYARTKAIHWGPAATYSIPGIASAFLTARVLTKVGQAPWIRAAFGAFLLVTALDMARRAQRAAEPAASAPRAEHSWVWLVLAGFIGGGLSALLGIGGGLIAVPVLLYVGRLPVKAVAPTALAGVCLTTLAGGLGYLTAGPGPQVSDMMAGFVDLRMALPLSLGALVTVPLGVRVQRRSSGPTLYRLFSAIFALIGLSLILAWLRSAA